MKQLIEKIEKAQEALKSAQSEFLRFQLFAADNQVKLENLESSGNIEDTDVALEVMRRQMNARLADSRNTANWDRVEAANAELVAVIHSVIVEATSDFTAKIKAARAKAAKEIRKLFPNSDTISLERMVDEHEAVCPLRRVDDAFTLRNPDVEESPRYAREVIKALQDLSQIQV